MYYAQLHNDVDAPWMAMEPIRVGGAPNFAPSGLKTPKVYVAVERDGMPFARIDAWPSWNRDSTKAVAWKHLIVLGMEAHVHLIDPLSRGVSSISCDGYFSDVYPVDDVLLIADATRLTCINERGMKCWESDFLGVDGVVVDDVREGVIVGKGEWDPPGGWEPFRLSLETGEAAAR